MCIGQIYLMAIVTVLQYINQFNIKAVLFLITYNLAMIIPIFIIAFLLIKGKSVFEMSEFVRENIPKIKVANCIVFTIIAIYSIIS